MNKAPKTWICARHPSNSGFKLHDHIARPLLGYFYEPDTETKEPRYGKGYPCYTPVDIVLASKNQYTALKRENRTEKPVAIFSGYTFIRDPSPSYMRILKDRGWIYSVLPNPLNPEQPALFTQRAIDLMRNKYGAEYDPETGAGHITSANPQAAMIPGYEYEEGEYVISDDPAWMGHKLLCTKVLDTQATVMFKMFGFDMEANVPLSALRKAS